jgi:hypothetical protein
VAGGRLPPATAPVTRTTPPASITAERNTRAVRSAGVGTAKYAPARGRRRHHSGAPVID